MVQKERGIRKDHKEGSGETRNEGDQNEVDRYKQRG